MNSQPKSRKAQSERARKRIVAFIAQFRQSYDCGPTEKEIGEACDVPVRSVAGYVRRLEDQGLIHRTAGRTRNLTVVESAPR